MLREGVVPSVLRAHWKAWLGAATDDIAHLGGARSTTPPVVVVSSPARTQPGWDGAVHQVVGIIDPDGCAVVSVPPADLDWSRKLLGGGADLDVLRRELPARLGLLDHLVYRATYQFATTPTGAAELPDGGIWLPVTDPLVPPWLRPFGGDALVALDAGDTTASSGQRYLAGVGLKRHDAHVHEIAVGTDEAARGRGLARRLVAQAARTLLARGDQGVPAERPQPRRDQRVGHR